MLLLLTMAAVILVLAGTYAYGVRALGAPPTVPALPEAPSPLQVRLLELDAAIADLREMTRHLTPHALRMCVLQARARLGSASLETFGLPAPPSGPGTEIVARLFGAIHAIDEEDRRTLADAGLDPHKILDAIDAPLDPEPWVAQLERTLDYVRAGIRRLPDRRYG